MQLLLRLLYLAGALWKLFLPAHTLSSLLLITFALCFWMCGSPCAVLRGCSHINSLPLLQCPFPVLQPSSLAPLRLQGVRAEDMPSLLNELQSKVSWGTLAICVRISDAQPSGQGPLAADVPLCLRDGRPAPQQQAAQYGRPGQGALNAEGLIHGGSTLLAF